MLACEKIFSVQQIRDADACTIKKGGISSWELMERAATACVNWISANIGVEKHFTILCGTGNNGGDGLAMARLLSQMSAAKTINVIIFRFSEKCTSDFSENYTRLKKCANVAIHELQPNSEFCLSQPTDYLVDAIIGSGLSVPVSGWLEKIIATINALSIPVIAIDIPSGLFADSLPASGVVAVKATDVLSFQFPKLSFLFSETADFVEQFHVLPIGLNEQYICQTPTQNYYITPNFIASAYKKRKKFAHKGIFGHALLIAGSYGKMGAAVLAAKACLRAGAGLLTVHVPTKGVEILQIAFPEAMVSADINEQIITHLPKNLSPYDAVGIGPSIGTDSFSQKALFQLLSSVKVPLILDADALNILSENPDWIKIIPPHSILTPHVKEFERLVGENFSNSIKRWEAAKVFAVQHQLILVLKGAHTVVCAPDGASYFNSTGNSGMATAGSGDVLTGIITSLLAQRYTPLEAAALGVFIHGKAGDSAVLNRTPASLIASDIIENISASY